MRPADAVRTPGPVHVGRLRRQSTSYESWQLLDVTQRVGEGIHIQDMPLGVKRCGAIERKVKAYVVHL